jgi:hypothetical protein
MSSVIWEAVWSLGVLLLQHFSLDQSSIEHFICVTPSWAANSSLKTLVCSLSLSLPNTWGYISRTPSINQELPVSYLGLPKKWEQKWLSVV